MEIDLRNCEAGDILISSHGAKLEYVKPLPEDDYFDHEVKYIEMADGSKPVGEYGSRTHDGYVMRYSRIPDKDHDIVEIISKKSLENKNK